MATPVEDQGAKHGAALTKSDTTIINPVTRAIWVGGAGDVTVMLENDNTAVTLKGVAAGTIVPVRIRQLMNATTATDVVALW